jgi:Dolichyl-phosphate-mannose-protein mannosyltransferase
MRPGSGAHGRVDLAGRHFTAAVVTVLLILGIVQVSSLRHEAASNDESPFLTAGYIYLRTGHNFERLNPPLARVLAALPLLRLEGIHQEDLQHWETASQALWHGPGPTRSVLFPSRLVTIAFTLAFGVWIALWTRRNFGAPAGLLALAFFAFDPTLIAHGRYATTDLLVSFFVFLSATLWIDFLQGPTRLRLAVAGIALGLAVASKFSALFLFLVLPGLYVVTWAGGFTRPDMPASSATFFSPRGAVVVGLGLSLGVIGVLGLAYAPEVFRLLNWLSGGQKPQPLSTLVAGLVGLFRNNATGVPAYLLGELSTSGWWYYFPVAFLVKTPSAVLVACGIALATIPLASRLSTRQRFAAACLVAVPLLFFCLAITASLNLGVRYILPIYAFLYVVLAFTLCEYGPLLFRQWWRPTLTALVVVLVIESLAIFPHYTSFFNALSGGPGHGRTYLLDSNIDWGQDLERLANYVREKQLSPVCAATFGGVPLQSYGVPATDLLEYEDLEHAGCVAAVSVNFLEGLIIPRETFAVLRARPPMARIGYSIYLFDLRPNAGR